MGMTHTHGGGRRTECRIYDVSLLILWLLLLLVLDSCATWAEEDSTATVSLCHCVTRGNGRLENKLVWNYQMSWFEE